MCTKVIVCMISLIFTSDTYHTFLTRKGVVIALAATIDITANSDMLGSIRESLIILDTDVHIGIALYISQVTAAIDVSVDVGAKNCPFCIGKTYHRNRGFCYDVDSGITRYITLVATAKDFAYGADAFGNISYDCLFIIGGVLLGKSCGSCIGVGFALARPCVITNDRGWRFGRVGIGYSNEAVNFDIAIITSHGDITWK